MSIRLGPILYILQSTATLWRFCVQLVIDDPPLAGLPAYTLQCADTGVNIAGPQLVADFAALNGWQVWKWPVEVNRTPRERTITYMLDGTASASHTVVDQVAIPASGYLPRLAFFSCNGFSDPAQRRRVTEPELMWQIMRTRHLRGLTGGHTDDPSGFHLLVGAGDQLYVDQLEVIRELDNLPRAQLQRLQYSAAWEQRAQRQYLEKYAQAWSYPDMAYMMARVPGIFTWDDHEILDGWGSHAAWLQQHPRYQSLYRVARKAFVALQLSGDPTEATPPPRVYRSVAPGTDGADHLLQTLSFREADRWLDLVLLDLRSHRTPETVLSSGQWQDFCGWLAQYVREAAAGPLVPRHLLLISSIPVVYLRYRIGDWLLRHLIPGVQEIEDDLLDQWEHAAHEGERARLIMTLLSTQKAANTQITILSGDVHVAARGRIVSTAMAHLRGDERQAMIHQITSSAIVHVPPTPLEFLAVEGFGTEGRHEVSDGVHTELLDVDAQRARLRARNFAAIAFDPPQAGAQTGRLWAEWVVEDQRPRRQLVIYPGGVSPDSKEV